MRVTFAAVALLAFGLVALVGLIVLAGTGHLSDSLQTALVSVVTLCVGGAAGVATPSHDHAP